VKEKILKELYEQVKNGMIPLIRKGQVERWEALISSILADIESHKAADRMKAASEDKGAVNE